MRSFGVMSILGLVTSYLYSMILTRYYGFDGILNYLNFSGFNGFYFYLLILPAIGIWMLFAAFSSEKLNNDYGNSRWAKLKDIKKMNIGMLSNEGMVFGVFGNKFIRTKETLSVIVAAPPGTGKTTAIAIPNLLMCDWSMIVNDVKNELWELTSNHRRKHQKVIRFAPAEENSYCWNPFNELPDDFGKQLIFLNRISSIIYPTVGDPDKDHWPLSARTLFSFFALVAILGKVKDGDELTFFSIRKAILSTEDIQGFAADYIDEFEQTDNKFLNNFIEENVNSILQFSDKEFSSVVSTTKTALEVFNDPYIQKSTSTSDFNIKELRSSKLTIYLSSNMKDSERVQPITRLFIELAAVELLSDKPNSDQKVLILADEFVKMGKMTQLIKTPDLSRGQKVAVIFIVQALSQPAEVYGAEITKTLISTTAFKIVFTQLAQETMKEISDLIGNKTIRKGSETKNHKLSSGGRTESTQISEEGQPLVLPQDIGSLSPDDVIIIVQGHNTTPIKAKALAYYNFENLKELVSFNDKNQ